MTAVAVSAGELRTIGVSVFATRIPTRRAQVHSQLFLRQMCRMSYWFVTHPMIRGKDWKRPETPQRLLLISADQGQRCIGRKCLSWERRLNVLIRCKGEQGEQKNLGIPNGHSSPWGFLDLDTRAWGYDGHSAPWGCLDFGIDPGPSVVMETDQQASRRLFTW